MLGENYTASAMARGQYGAQLNSELAIAEQRAAMRQFEDRQIRAEALRLALPHFGMDVDGAIDAAEKLAAFLRA